MKSHSSELLKLLQETKVVDIPTVKNQDLIEIYTDGLLADAYNVCTQINLFKFCS